ncbi:hypothetical protein RJ639_031353 [Escallonia herrerae]|uniref:NAC domain-containing protein n=1 Tax=Escallonia herrerae TaxID=1293975 RepID=A0AA88XCQ9_9ASTE|nr:hypothetical protein RJ639_031353 [Escallonia herrerae]
MKLPSPENCSTAMVAEHSLAWLHGAIHPLGWISQVPKTNENQELKGDQLYFNILRPNSAPKGASFGMATITSSSSNHEEAEEKIPQTNFSAISSRVLPYGFRFSPSDSQLIEHYLLNKIMGRELPSDYITYNAHLYEHHPAAQAAIDISARACRLEDKNAAYFFTHSKPSLIQKNGYWKASAEDVQIENNENQIVGFKRTLVFYQGKVAEGERTHWTVLEYRVNPKAIPNLDSSLETEVRILRLLADLNVAVDATIVARTKYQAGSS